MMILSDQDLRYYIEERWIDINPLERDTVRENGVDLRVGNEIARFKATEKVFRQSSSTDDFFIKEQGESFIIGANEHVLLVTREYIKLPNDVIAFVNLRSSFARLGLLVPPTIVDAGFQGQLTIEVVGSQFPVEITAGTRFLHLVFAKTLTPVKRPYTGKYQGQGGVTLTK